MTTLADRLERALPQTQCTRCGFADCRAYAEAVAAGDAAINRCPPGGAEGIERLAALSGQPVLPLDRACGIEAPRSRAVIDEATCIGCMLCIAACPVDCIVGAPKRMHSIVAEQCTGCELCLPACPVDCIVLVAASGERSGWAAWSAEQAEAAAARYRRRQSRRAMQAPAVRDAAGPVGHGAESAAAEPPLSAAPGPSATAAPADLLRAALARAGGRQPAGR